MTNLAATLAAELPGNRLNVSLVGDDPGTLATVRAALEARLGRRLSYAEVVRICVRDKAASLGNK